MISQEAQFCLCLILICLKASRNKFLRGRSIDIYQLSAIAQMWSKPFQCRTSNSNRWEKHESNYSDPQCQMLRKQLRYHYGQGLRPLIFLFDLPNHSQHDNLRPILTPRKHRKPKKNLSTGFTLSTQNQWMPPIPLIYSEVHVTIFPPIARLLLILIKSNSTQNSFIRSETLEITALWIFHGGNSNFINSFDKFLLQSSTDQTPQFSLETRHLLTTFAI